MLSSYHQRIRLHQCRYFYHWIWYTTCPATPPATRTPQHDIQLLTPLVMRGLTVHQYPHLAIKPSWRTITNRVHFLDLWTMYVISSDNCLRHPFYSTLLRALPLLHVGHWSIPFVPPDAVSLWRSFPILNQYPLSSFPPVCMNVTNNPQRIQRRSVTEETGIHHFRCDYYCITQMEARRLLLHH